MLAGVPANDQVYPHNCMCVQKLKYRCVSGKEGQALYVGNPTYRLLELGY